MTKTEAIDILSDELRHTRFHLQEKGKAPEFYKELGDYCDALDLAIKALEQPEQASAQPERKKGKWYLRDTARYGGLPYICTVCGKKANEMYDFCPTCGADMRGGENDETPQEQKLVSAEWIPLGHRMGPFKHPLSEDYKCSVCGHEVYTLMWTPPEYCPACRSFMKNGGMRFVESLKTDGGKPDER